MEPVAAAPSAAMQMKDWVPVVVGGLALVGIVINVTLTWRLGRHKTQSEKTWEKRREVYTELLKKLRVIVRIVHEQQEMREFATDDLFVARMRATDFREGVEDLRLYVEDHILYVSDDMEEAFLPLWGALDQIHKRVGGRARGERTPPDQQQELFFTVTTRVNDAVKALAREEIRVRSV